MSLSKKVFLLLVLLIGLIFFTVYSFNYKTIITDGKEQENINNPFAQYTDAIKNKFDELKSGIETKVDELSGKKSQKQSETVNFEVVKKDGLILMNGIFRDEAQVKEISDILNINRDGDYKFNGNIQKNDELLQKLSSLISPLKNFFEDGSKISIENGEVSLAGTLSDPNYKDLVDSILSRLKFDIKTNIIKPEVSKTQKIIDSMKNVVKKDEQIEQEVAFADEASKKIMKAKVQNENNSKIKDNKIKLSENAQKIQDDINKLLEEKKITFKRRSTSITNKSFETVKEIANILKENDNLTVEIAGHTDSRGRASLNKRISQDRANSVKEALVKLSVNSKSLKAVGYGEEFPIAKDDKDGLSEINRRVEFNIIGE